MLNETTLFYWTLSDSYNKQKDHHSAIIDWASAIPALKSGSASQASKSTSSYCHSTKSIVPSPTNDPDTASSHSSASSVLSNNVKIISRQPDVVNVENKPGLSNTYRDGDLSDNDEIMGEEREVATNSPPNLKGKKRVASEVFLFIYIYSQ